MTTERRACGNPRTGTHEMRNNEIQKTRRNDAHTKNARRQNMHM